MRLLRLLLAALVGALSLVLLGTGTSYACSCVAGTTAEHVAWADVVVTGTVTHVVPPPQKEVMSSGDPVTYVVAVDRVFKGAAADRLEIRSAMSGASCGLEGVLPGRRYLFFAGAGAADGPAEKASANLCGGTAEATADLVEEVQAVTGPGAPPETGDRITPTSYQPTDKAGVTKETKGGDWALPLALVAGGGLVLLTAGLWVRYALR